MEPTSETQSTNSKTKRISTIETGHAKNADNLVELINVVTGYGAAYNPNTAILKLPQLNTLAATAKNDIADVITENTAYNNAVNAREFAFSDLKPLATRVINSLESTDALPAKVKDAQGFNRKLQGKRATPAETS